jgi:hypothetical protein
MEAFLERRLLVPSADSTTSRPQSLFQRFLSSWISKTPGRDAVWMSAFRREEYPRQDTLSGDSGCRAATGPGAADQPAGRAVRLALRRSVAYRQLDDPPRQWPEWHGIRREVVLRTTPRIHKIDCDDRIHGEHSSPVDGAGDSLVAATGIASSGRGDTIASRERDHCRSRRLSNCPGDPAAGATTLVPLGRSIRQACDAETAPVRLKQQSGARGCSGDQGGSPTTAAARGRLSVQAGWMFWLIWKKLSGS